MEQSDIPTERSEGSGSDQLNYLNIIIIFLTIYVLGALAVDALYDLPKETSRLLEYIDHFICGIFILDFIIRFAQAERKWQFMKSGWIDLLSSIPAVGYLRVGRIYRLIRLLRGLRAFRSVRAILKHVFQDKAQGTFISVSIIALLLVIFSAIAILQVETAPNSNIKTAEDALWWAYVTITSVGYGDKFPVTSEGRIVAALLMTTGAGLFVTFTAYVASWFVGEKEE